MSPASDSTIKTKSQMPPAQVDRVEAVTGNPRQKTVKTPLQPLPGLVEQEESEL